MIAHTIYEWYIELHLVDFNGKFVGYCSWVVSLSHLVYPQNYSPPPPHQARHTESPSIPKKPKFFHPIELFRRLYKLAGWQVKRLLERSNLSPLKTNTTGWKIPFVQ